MIIHRQIIKARDIQIYFGKSQSMSNKMLRQMRLALRKMPYQPIIIREFCDYYQVDEESIVKVISSNDTPIPKTSITATQNLPAENKAKEEFPATKKDTESYKFQDRSWNR